MKAYQQRVIEEIDDLSNKYRKLSASIGTDTHKKLDSKERVLLKQQLYVMLEYIEILNKRIKLFNE